MTKKDKSPEDVDTYLATGCMRCRYGNTPQCKVHAWKEILQKLRAIALNENLTETIKWGVPCYTHLGKNIVIIAAFKEYAALSFFEGAYLPDPKNLLQKPGEHTQTARLLKFKTSAEVEALQCDIVEFINQAKASRHTHRSGMQNTNATPLPYPAELEDLFKEDPTFETAFKNLTKGKQRGYILFFNQAKQAKTRIERIRKYIADIKAGKGLHEEYGKGTKKK